MRLSFYILRLQVRQYWQATSTIAKVGIILSILFLALIFIGNSFWMSSEIENLQETLAKYTYLGRYYIFFMGLSFFLPIIVPVSHIFQRHHPISPLQSILSNIYSDIFLNGRSIFILFMIIFLFIGMRLESSYFSISLICCLLIVLLSVRIIQNALSAEQNKIKHLLCILPFIAYLIWNTPFFQMMNPMEFIIDLAALMIVFPCTIYSEKHKQNPLKKGNKLDLKLSDFWTQLIFNNVQSKRLIYGAITTTLLVTVYSFLGNKFEAFEAGLSPFKYYMLAIVLPTGMFLFASSNFWVTYNALYRNLDFAGSQMNKYYQIYLKYLLQMNIILFPIFILYIYIIDLDFTAYILSYLCIALAFIPIGMYFSFHKSRILTKQKGLKSRKGKAPIALFIIVFSFTGLAILFNQLNLMYLNILFPLIGIIFHYLMKEDYTTDRYIIYQKIRESK